MPTAMLQAHSWLWNYLWVAPNILLLVLAAALRRRGLHRVYPAFFVFAVVGAVAELISYGADIASNVTANVWWHVFWAVLLVEALLKFTVLAEVFQQTYHSYPAIARLGRNLIRGTGIFLVFLAALVDTFAAHDSQLGIIRGAHLIQQSSYLVETGILVFILAFSRYFRVPMLRASFGIALGLAISATVHLANAALVANAGLPNETRYRLEFVSMGTYHFVVLLWAYYLLVPQRRPSVPAITLPDNDTLSSWNRELERLLHQ
ncbi:MAG TPA: hypothetical protein VKV39_19465 [Candidatus Sulfotelmatobacter sp.]|nr:hypothetical protein [Candidatus Sulfotelmatobacter sp.]